MSKYQVQDWETQDWETHDSDDFAVSLSDKPVPKARPVQRLQQRLESLAIRPIPIPRQRQSPAPKARSAIDQQVEIADEETLKRLLNVCMHDVTVKDGGLGVGTLRELAETHGLIPVGEKATREDYRIKLCGYFFPDLKMKEAEARVYKYGKSHAPAKKNADTSATLPKNKGKHGEIWGEETKQEKQGKEKIHLNKSQFLKLKAEKNKKYIEALNDFTEILVDLTRDAIETDITLLGSKTIFEFAYFDKNLDRSYIFYKYMGTYYPIYEMVYGKEHPTFGSLDTTILPGGKGALEILKTKLPNVKFSVVKTKKDPNGHVIKNSFNIIASWDKQRLF